MTGIRKKEHLSQLSCGRIWLLNKSLHEKGKGMDVPLLKTIVDNYEKIKPFIEITPVLPWKNSIKSKLLNDKTEVVFKCELFQKTGTFKLRGALTRFSALNEDEKTRGIVAGTAGNHGIAVAYVAKLKNIHAKIVVPKIINTFRLNKIKSLGAEVIQVDTMSEVLDVMNDIAEKENRTIIHAYDHPLITLGTATLGYEFLQQVPNLDVIIVPIGGGGLASGVSAAAKKINPHIKVYGVEPEGANALYLSFQKNEPIALSSVKSIADSLCAPRAMPYSFSICKQYLDDIVLVTEQELSLAMKLLFEEVKMACEAACAAATAGLLGPLKDSILGKKVGVLLCGSNIDVETFSKHVKTSQS